MTPRYLTSLALAALTLNLGGMALAQTANTNNPMEGWQQNGNANDLGSILNPQNGNFSVPGLMNRLRLIDGRDPNEVVADQMENLNAEAEAFRKRQQQQFQNLTVTP
ncbi:MULTISPECIES: hypothetical protein [unclassified Thermosynechococcus]|uniref:hypothetical protein n=1 Tax=unclassified Thermosynechococcus TaxID=2622553 RepID=UPI002873CE00|nr:MULTISPECIES: hypothetical protein [unclassified Thermosynechococcus]WNC21332.1 hypothetical protein RHG98_07965 [Thermosynechococcus sp. PP22]WNC31574.1 hypothetical protein RHH81_07935 [Thermosynechococcus sp. PKX95]WNC34098.1 hypothetical protein RHH79_07930 [Thermosynechococcus sp. PKX91]WNC36620.1 hypothetical protein RHI11_07925 [Thermosynechococcus sp. WL11]WNC39141.1 hypothetical protein RHI18_07925 [Thermosynechococcus sp. WL17]